ncbi:hypothetical protein CIRMBP1286_02170 [Enterococcus cecorum]|nr:hypothetical protein CIRMBP1286_02170 [Enterococcus cecorum]
MDARKENIIEILNVNKQFIISVYQRFYSWNIVQCQPVGISDRLAWRKIGI